MPFCVLEQNCRLVTQCVFYVKSEKETKSQGAFCHTLNEFCINWKEVRHRELGRRCKPTFQKKKKCDKKIAKDGVQKRLWINANQLDSFNCAAG
jgi:hypothetical protein